MKLLSVLTLTLFVGISAQAQNRGNVRTSNDFSSSMSGSAITGYLGFGQTALNVGAEFESAMNSDAGIGGYFLLLTEGKDNGRTYRPQIITFGGDVKVHYRPGDFDFYAAPGVGVLMYESNSNDETTVGPSMRIGVLYAMTPKFGIGLEHATLFNWFSKDIGVESYETSNVAFRMAF